MPKPHRRLTRVQGMAGSLIVKEFIGVRAAGKAERSWLNTHRLAWLGLPVQAALALRPSPGASLLILEDVGDMLLHSELRDALTAERRRELLDKSLRATRGLLGSNSRWSRLFSRFWLL